MLSKVYGHILVSKKSPNLPEVVSYTSGTTPVRMRAKNKRTKKPVSKPAPDRQVSDEAIDPDGGSDGFIERIYGRHSKWFVTAVLVFGCILIYFQVREFQFVNFDDNNYVYNNPHVTGGLNRENVRWAFSAFFAANWHPLTWLSHQLDATLFGLDAGSHHLVNALVHTINSVLLFFLLRKLTGSTWKRAIVAAIFAFHPAHVESVAWVSERKDVLSTLFGLLCIWFYDDYARAKNRTRNYVLMLVCFVLSLLAKPMMVTLPFVLLLLDLWPLNRIEKLQWNQIRPLLIEKVPLFALVIGSCVMTFLAQRAGGAVMALDYLPISSRVINAIIAYTQYIGMLFYPLNLGGWYPYKEEGYPLWQIAGSVALLIAISTFAVLSFRRRKFLLVGWLWFLGMLVPVIGLVQVGRQSHADRYTYLPFIGLSIAVVWLAAAALEKWKINKDLITAGVFIILIAMGLLCFRQVSYWRDNESFYRQTLAVTEKNYLFEQNYCQYLIESDRLDEAEVQCRNSIKHNITPYANSWVSLGLLEMKRKNYEAALKDFEIASRLRPSDIVSFSNYINALIALDRLDEAAEKTRLIRGSEIAEELKNPYLYSLFSQISYRFAQSGQPDKAIENAPWRRN